MPEEGSLTRQGDPLLHFHFRPAAHRRLRVQLHDSGASESRRAEFHNFRYEHDAGYRSRFSLPLADCEKRVENALGISYVTSDAL